MGETKKIDIPALAEACKRFYPALKAAAALEVTGIAYAMRKGEFSRFGYIKDAARCSVSAANNFLSAAVKAGVVEKDPEWPLYRLVEYETTRGWAQKCLSEDKQDRPLHRAERLVFSFIRYATVFNALQNGELCLGEIQKKIGLAQSPASLKMSRLHEYGWVNKRRDGKNVYYSLSDYTRRFLLALAVAGL